MLLLVLMLLLLRNVLLEFNLGLGWLAKQRVHHLFLERAHAQRGGGRRSRPLR
jgi:hypothetical protein